MDAKLEWLYRAIRPEHTYVAYHQHNCCELVYYIDGEGTSRIGDHEFAYLPGHFALIRPSRPHDERRRTVTDVLFIGFRYDERSVALPEGIFRDDGGLIRRSLLRVQEEFAEKRPHYTAMLNLLVGQLLIECARLLGESHALPAAGKRLQYARTFLDEHFHQKIHMSTLADQCGYSYDRFRHLFKEETGYSPLHYLMAKRLDRARDLLIRSDWPVAEIASRCGFSSDAQFCHIFKRESGMTPRQFRDGERRGSALRRA